MVVKVPKERAMTCGYQKDENLIKKSVRKVRKNWSKTGSPKVHILTLKAKHWPSFFGTLKIDVSKDQGYGACVHPSYPARKNH